jgi:hypothetical protein
MCGSIYLTYGGACRAKEDMLCASCCRLCERIGTVVHGVGKYQAHPRGGEE